MNNAHLSLFSGIGGLDLAAEWAGFRTVAFVERDKYCQRVLAKHWPGVPIYGDVAEVTADACRDGFVRVAQQDERPEAGEQASRRNDAERLAAARGPIAILSGGFPCQPHSVAGKRKASADERDLWSECARITAEFRPRWAVFENVPGLLTSERGTFFARVLGDLAALGYRVGWGVWGANDVGALHRRDRVFIVANAGYTQVRRGAGCDEARGRRSRSEAAGSSEDVADSGCTGREERDAAALADGAGYGAWSADPTGKCWGAEPDVGRVAARVPKRVDRLRALGNAVVPQQAYPIFKAIAEIEGINGPPRKEC